MICLALVFMGENIFSLILLLLKTIFFLKLPINLIHKPFQKTSHCFHQNGIIQSDLSPL